MIITVTPNAALDKTIQVPSLQIGMRHRGAHGFVAPGGKGINVARSLLLLGQPVIATGLAGGETGSRIQRELDAEGILNDFTPIGGESRASTVLIDPLTGRPTEIIENGPSVNADELAALLDRLEYVARDASIVVLAGSLPRDVPEAWYADAIKRLRRSTGAHLVLDSEAEPHLVAPNQLEAEELVGHEFSGEGDLLDALHEIADMGARNVLITHEGGAVALVREGGQERVLRAAIPRVEAVSAVGAGDALLAGFLAARRRDASAEDALRQAVACGTASTLVPGAGVFDPREAKRQAALVEVVEPSLR